jgi:hypothetical protein
MRTIQEIINFFEKCIIECDPEDGCLRCNEARGCVASLRAMGAAEMPTELIETMTRLLMDSALKCPHCGGVGYTVHPNYHTGEPEQEQCRWCHDFEWFRNRMKETK